MVKSQGSLNYNNNIKSLDVKKYKERLRLVFSHNNQENTGLAYLKKDDSIENKHASCMTFLIEGQCFGLLLSKNCQIVLEDSNATNTFIDVRKILDMPPIRRPSQNVFINRNNTTYKMEVDVRGNVVPFPNIQNDRQSLKGLWKQVAEGVNYISEQPVIMLNFEKILGFSALKNTINHIDNF